jgi:predicted acetyltransferase
MHLTPPDLSYAEPFRRYVEDCRRAGDTRRVSKYAAGTEDFPAYVESLRLAARGIDLPEDKVPYHTFWLIEAGEIAGIVRVRPQLTPKAERNDGHIGYDVAPSRRGKGYGTELLRLSLVEARKLGLSRVLITCATSNTGSRRVIEKCGGRLLGEVMDEDDDQPIYRFELLTPELSTSAR